MAAEPLIPASIAQSYPSPDAVRRSERRARGIAATTLGEGRRPADEFAAASAVDIEILFSGGIRALASGLVFNHEHPRASEGLAFLLDDAAVAWCHRLVGWARELGDELGYRGAWGFGVLLAGIEGVRAAPQYLERQLPFGMYGLGAPVYDAPDYERVATATRQEMDAEPGAVVDRLVGDLVYTLGAGDRYADAL